MSSIKQATIAAIVVMCSAVNVTAMMDVALGEVAMNANCTGGGATCSTTQTMGSVGDLFAVNPTTEQVTQLGTITQEATKKLNLPEKVDGYILYSFAPKEGELAGTTIHLGLRLSEKGSPGSRLAGMYPVELFRLTANQDAKKGWDRIAQFVVKGAQDQKGASSNKASLTFLFMPNGNISTIDSKGTKRETIYSGSKNLNR